MFVNVSVIHELFLAGTNAFLTLKSVIGYKGRGRAGERRKDDDEMKNKNIMTTMVVNEGWSILLHDLATQC